jgi:hypothetical protein
MASWLFKKLALRISHVYFHSFAVSANILKTNMTVSNVSRNVFNTSVRSTAIQSALEYKANEFNYCILDHHFPITLIYARLIFLKMGKDYKLLNV